MKRILTIIVLLFSVSTLGAEVKLPALVGDNMVLQRNATVNIWGWADAGKNVTVTTSWNGETYTARTNADGSWKVGVQTPEAGGPYEIRISDGTEIVLKNILLGEVWVCSGQSNMAMSLQGGFSEPVNEANETIARAGMYPDIRLFTVGRKRSETPVENCEGAWLVSSPQNAASFSAVAYFFGRNLNEMLGVPVGLINASWGGTFIEAWMEAESQQGVTPPAVKTTSSMNSELYNGMIVPLFNYTIAGWTWYQGENNQVNPFNYAELMQRLVKLWRDKWGQGELPFYYVQIAPYIYSDAPRDGVSVAELRDQQTRAMQLIPNSGMAATLDLGDPVTVHHPNKRQVGDRLAYWALANTYRQEGITFRAPEYNSMEIGEDGKVRITFNYAQSGLLPCDVELGGFELAGADQRFYPAKAILRFGRRNPVEVWCDEVPAPIAVRYAWRNYTEASLFNTMGLPVSSFRSDDWEIDYPHKK